MDIPTCETCRQPMEKSSAELGVFECPACGARDESQFDAPESFCERWHLPLPEWARFK